MEQQAKVDVYLFKVTGDSTDLYLKTSKLHVQYKAGTLKNLCWYNNLPQAITSKHGMLPESEFFDLIREYFTANPEQFIVEVYSEYMYRSLLNNTDFTFIVKVKKTKEFKKIVCQTKARQRAVPKKANRQKAPINPQTGLRSW
jgi:hypothetical protein